jgi:hypothetical protein
MYTKIDWKCCDENDGTTEEVLTLKGIHYAKLVCAHCKHFIKWLPNPNITKAVEERATHIDQMLTHTLWTDKQRGFLTQIKTKRFLSPPQETFYRGLCQKIEK